MVSIVTGIIGLSIAILIIVLVRRDRLHVTHGMGWIIVAVGFAFLGFAPSIVDKLAQNLGVDYPPVLALTLGISILVVKILLMDIERSRIETRNQRLIQRVAMLEADLNAMQQSNSSKNSTSSERVVNTSQER